MGNYISREEMEEFQPRYHKSPIRIEGFEIKDRIDNIEKNLQDVKVDQDKIDNLQKNLQDVKVDLEKLMNLYKD